MGYLWVFFFNLHMYELQQNHDQEKQLFRLLSLFGALFLCMVIYF